MAQINVESPATDEHWTLLGTRSETFMCGGRTVTIFDTIEECVISGGAVGRLGELAVNETVTTREAAMVGPDKANEQHEDDAVAEALTNIQTLLHATERMPHDVEFVFCADPADVGVSREQLADMEKRAYANANYGDRAEGEVFFSEALRGYQDGEHHGLRFVVLVRHQGDEITPLAFFNYFAVTRHLSPEHEAAATQFVAQHALAEQPDLVVVSKLVADPGRARDVGELHRYALAAVLNALASSNGRGIFLETQAQPATRRMVSKSARRYIPGLEVLLDEELPEYTEQDGGIPSRMLLYIPPSM